MYERKKAPKEEKALNSNAALNQYALIIII
jgi:hypothetical protein